MKQKYFLRAAARCLAFATVGLLSLQAQAAPTELYLYKENGMPVYSSRKPEHVPYTVVIPAKGVRAAPTQPPAPAVATATANNTATRPGWASSCLGITEQMMQERAKPLNDIVARQAKTHGVPAGLVRAVMRVESCFDLRAVSHVGARGVMQLMPATASALGVRDLFNAEQNISGGVRYLRELLDRFDQDTQLAIAAYNAGPNAVSRHGGIPPYPETQRYVERVFAAYRENHKPASKKKLS